MQAFLRDRPFWVGMVLLIVASLWIWSKVSAWNQSAEALLDEVFATLSRTEIRLKESRKAASRKDEQPRTAEKTLDSFMDAFSYFGQRFSRNRKELKDLEDMYGRTDPRTFTARAARIAIFAFDPGPSKSTATRLAESNFLLANGSGPLTAKQRLVAADQVLRTLPLPLVAGEKPKRQKRLLELVRFTSEHAEGEPKLGVDLLVDIGEQQLKLGLVEDAVSSFREAISLGERGNVDRWKLGLAHLGVTVWSWGSGDCDAALDHAFHALSTLRNSINTSDNLGRHLLRKMAPIREMAPTTRKCRPSATGEEDPGRKELLLKELELLNVES